MVLLFFILCSLAYAEHTVYSLPPSEVFGGALENAEALEIKSEEWEGKNLSLADLLATYAGIQTRQTGGMGSFQSVSIRGMQGNQIALAIDGVILQGFGTADLGSIDLSQYEKIEIYKGYVPAKFAANGMGGVINLVSKDAAAKGGKFYASYGSYNSRFVSIQASSPLSDSVFWRSNIGYRASDNNFPYLNRNGTAYNAEDDFWTKRKNAEYSQISGNHSFRIAHSKRNSVFRLEHRSEAGGIPGREDQETKTANSATDAVLASYELEPSDKETSFGLLGFAGIERDLSRWYYPLDKIGYPADEYAKVGLLAKNAGGQGSFYLEKSFVKTEFHGYFNYQYLESQNNSAMLTNYELSNSVLQASLAATLAPVDYFNIKLNATSRFSKQKKESGEVSAVNFNTGEYKERSGNLNSGRVSVNFENIFLAVGHYFREPSVFELFSTGFGIVPNPNLKAEQGEQAEFGVSYKTKKTRASAILFANRIRDRIIYHTSGSFSKPLNAERGEVYGLEAEIFSEPFKWLQMNSNATFQNPGNLPNEPKEQYYSSLLFLLPNSFELSLEGEANSVIYRDKAKRKKIPESAFYHAGLSYKPTSKTKISFYAKNLNGAEYQHIYDAYPTPGRMFYLSYSHGF
jgi:outer membrane cobalamin receptor